MIANLLLCYYVTSSSTTFRKDTDNDQEIQVLDASTVIENEFAEVLS